MSFDISRNTFNAWNDYLGVVMLQGKVQLDSDWNEWQAEYSRRIQAGTVDIFGRSAYPVTTPFAFKINTSATGSGLTIGAGRMYVDGLLAENHGLVPAAFTVVAASSVANPGTYGIQITAGAVAGQFNFSLVQPGAAGVIGTLSNLTLTSLQSAVNGNAAIAQVVQIEDIAPVGQPVALPGPGCYMLAPSGPDYAVTIPSATALSWDPALAELSGASLAPGTPEVDIDFTQQPYLPGAQNYLNNALAGGTGPFLVYLDVWKRAVTFLEHPELIEPAVGVETTGRLQTVWQVKLMAVSSSVTCSTPDSQIANWSNLLLPPGGNLTTGVVQSAPDGPCALTPNTGYTGMENQLYRVEIQQAGGPTTGSGWPVASAAAGTATFKWSRENGSVATSVSGISSVFSGANTVSQLAVRSLGRDQVLGFNSGDWIEITDDFLELNGLAGELHQIDSVSAPDRTITLMDAITSTNFPVTSGLTDPGRHTRIKRWDQKGKVYLSDGATVYFDLGPATSGGAIPVPPAGTTLLLENGVTVTFGVAATGQFNIGNYWNFAARAADGTVETLVQAPPLGIHHHYARLGLVSISNPPSPATDCRTPWPPNSSGCPCECSVTVSPTSIGLTPLQSILDQYAGQTAGVVVCFMPGTYDLPEPIRLDSTYPAVTLSACESGTVLLQAQPGQESRFQDGMIVLNGATGVTISGLEFQLPFVPFTPSVFAGLPVSSLDSEIAALAQTSTASIGVRAISCTGLTIEDCQFQFRSVNAETAFGYSFEVGIFAEGQNSGWKVVRNEFVWSSGIMQGAPPVVKFENAMKTPVGVRRTIKPINENGTRVVPTDPHIFVGFLLCPAVAFAAPSTGETIAPISDGNVTTQQGSEKKIISSSGLVEKQAGNVTEKASVSAAKGTAAPAKELSTEKRTDLVEKTPVSTKTATAESAKETSVSEKTSITDLPKQAVLGSKLVGVFGDYHGAPLPGRAAAGGAVLPAVLEEAVFEGNSFTGLTVAILMVAEMKTVALIANTVTNGVAGFWMFSPVQAGLALYDPALVAGPGLLVAMSYALPATPNAASNSLLTQVTVPAAPQTIRIYPGESRPDNQGNIWSNDTAYATGGAISKIYQETITGVADENAFLYQIERWGNKFSYTFTQLATGFYTVTLKFAEIHYIGAPGPVGSRIFDVSINGTPYLIRFNIVTDAGGALIADDKVFYNVTPKNGEIVISFQGEEGGDTNAKISAVEIDPQWSGASPEASPFQPLPADSSFVDFFSQLAQVAQQGFAGLPVEPMQLRLTGNELHGLTSSAIAVLGDDQLQNGKGSSLMMTGNRMDSTVPFNEADNEKLRRLQTTAGDALRYLYFYDVCNLSMITWCVLSGNMILNLSAYNEQVPRGALLLDNLALPIAVPPVLTVPAPQVTVEGNVIQGSVLLLPTPPPFNSFVP